MRAAVTLTAMQAETVLSALDDAAEARRERAAATCHECAVHPAELCPGHEADLNRASEYDALAGHLYDTLAAQPASLPPATVGAGGPGPVSKAAMRAVIAATHAGGGSGLWNLAGTGPAGPAREARKHIIRAVLAAGATANGGHLHD